ncbi:hypothetical protein L7F22_043108 [Adiantum nelumboides]|nr:hypothetical protein [Adiantum nelumboides]
MKRRIFGTAFADDTELKSLDCVTVVSDEEVSEVKTSGSSRPLDRLGGQRILECVTGKADPGQLTIIIGASVSLLCRRAKQPRGSVGQRAGRPGRRRHRHARPHTDRSSRIGDARNRGISGGEARRVSLGVALVARPKILIADECTSGLDAVSARRVMDALRALATGSETGTTVIATLHQPSSDVFHMADSVILLDRGTVAFDGPPSQAVHFCRQQGMPVEVGYNVADSLMSYAFQRRRCASSPSKRVGRGGDGRAGEDAGGLQTTLTRTSLAFHHGGDKPVTTYMTQLHALLGRVWIMTCRDRSGPATTHSRHGTSLHLYRGCFFQVGLDIGGFQNRVGSIFFIYILILFFSLSALTLFAKGRLLMMRERANGLYSPWSWLSSHLVYDLGLLRLVPSLIIASIVYWMVGLHKSAALFFQFLLITVLFNWTVSVYQMLLAALLEDTSTAILYGALFILFNIAFAGFILNLQNVPAVIRWLQWICPLKYALEAVASNELKDLLLVDKYVSARRRFQGSSSAHPCAFSSTVSGCAHYVACRCRFLPLCAVAALPPLERNPCLPLAHVDDCRPCNGPRRWCDCARITKRAEELYKKRSSLDYAKGAMPPTSWCSTTIRRLAVTGRAATTAALLSPTASPRVTPTTTAPSSGPTRARRQVDEAARLPALPDKQARSSWSERNLVDDSYAWTTSDVDYSFKVETTD